MKSELANDEYLSAIPSFHHSLEMFHANKDCVEVREKFLKYLSNRILHITVLLPARKKTYGERSLI